MRILQEIDSNWTMTDNASFLDVILMAITGPFSNKKALLGFSLFFENLILGLIVFLIAGYLTRYRLEKQAKTQLAPPRIMRMFL
jgi:ACR3 family arsenite efflux pump ArsB